MNVLLISIDTLSAKHLGCYGQGITLGKHWHDWVEKKRYW